MSKRKATEPIKIRSTMAQAAWMRNGAGTHQTRVTKPRGGRSEARRRAIADAS